MTAITETRCHYHIVTADPTLYPTGDDGVSGPFTNRAEAVKYAHYYAKAQADRERRPLAGKDGNYIVNYVSIRTEPCTDPHCWY